MFAVTVRFAHLKDIGKNYAQSKMRLLITLKTTLASVFGAIRMLKTSLYSGRSDILQGYTEKNSQLLHQNNIKST